jgi:hypothetical protein
VGFGCCSAKGDSAPAGCRNSSEGLATSRQPASCPRPSPSPPCPLPSPLIRPGGRLQPVRGAQGATRRGDGGGHRPRLSHQPHLVGVPAAVPLRVHPCVFIPACLLGECCCPKERRADAPAALLLPFPPQAGEACWLDLAASRPLRASVDSRGYLFKTVYQPHRCQCTNRAPPSPPPHRRLPRC